jgi:predicted DNA-binding transcriptional regulator AlpA
MKDVTQTSNPQMPNPLADRYIDVKELAVFTGVPVSSLREFIAKGRGPVGTKIGRCLRFRISSVNTWLASLGDTVAK